MDSRKIRSTFINYFRNKDHKAIPGSSLVPANDPTLLFTNSGMVQFKDVFLGTEQINCQRAVTAQRCVRAGGKHNDLDNVGYTARHHTFFEMLGNFSFGDYFKEQAIYYAWEFVTKVLKLPEERLWVTIHHEDTESEDIWLNKMKVSPDRFSRLNESNFWSMGDVGPCGPCSEIFYDHGVDVPGGPPGTPDEDGNRYVEIWNLVFMQYQRDAAGKLTPLTNPSIDTGMGLERVAAVMQGKVSNYATDLFTPIIKAAARLTGCGDLNTPSLQVIADHIRSSSLILLDGVTPSNEGRGYVLRRIIRRAVRHGHTLGCDGSFFAQLVDPFIETVADHIPELVKNAERIKEAISAEEEQFQRTLHNGMIELEKALATMEGKIINGKLLFRLYDTFGFPVDMVNDMARERGYSIDLEGFEAEMAQQKEQSRNHTEYGTHHQLNINIESDTIFTGYRDHQQQTTLERLLIVNKDKTQPAKSLREKQKGIVILKETPFYAESGGQVADSGKITSNSGIFIVEDVQKQGKLIYHIGTLSKGELHEGEDIKASIDSDKRQNIMRNHSATHLLHAALRKVLGDGVIQRGSLVDANRLRFDFSHTKAVTTEQLQQINTIVNEQITANLAVTVEEMPIAEATSRGALAFFEEKYGDQVRVLTMSDTAEPFSVELCGGTHVSYTGDIGSFYIINERGIASGVRRIEAITAQAVINKLVDADILLSQLSSQCKTSADKLLETVESLQQQISKQANQISTLQAKLATASTDGGQEVEQLGNINAIIKQVDATPPGTISQIIDQMKNTVQSGVVVLAGEFQNKVVLAAGVTNDLTSQFKAGDLLRELAPIVDGKAGGKPHFAQGGGTNPQAINKLLAAARDVINNHQPA